MSKRNLILTILLAAGLSLHAAIPAGTYRLIKDSNGTTPKTGAVISLKFSVGKLFLRAAMPGKTVTDSGTYRISGNRITVRFRQFPFKCTSAAYSIADGKLKLPFKVLSGGSGHSLWQKESALSTFSGDGSGSGSSGKTPSGSSGSSGGSGSPSGSAPSGNGGPGGTRPGDPSNADPGAGSTPVKADKCPFAHLVGQWSGKGAGAEVRFRRRGGFRGGPKFNVMTLTTKHGTEFFFYVFKNGTVKGEGVILYNLDVNLSGLDALAGAVKGLMGLMPFPSMPNLPASSGMAKGIMEAKGVTGTSYSYKMVDAPQQRRFKIRGRVYRSGNSWKIRLETNGGFHKGSTKDNKLYVEYSVNLQTTRKSFPTWSPFLKSSNGDGLIRKAAGGKVYLAESNISGKHRGGVRVWQEYTFSWYARKVR